VAATGLPSSATDRHPAVRRVAGRRERHATGSTAESADAILVADTSGWEHGAERQCPREQLDRDQRQPASKREPGLERE